MPELVEQQNTPPTIFFIPSEKKNKYFSYILIRQ